MSEQKPQYHPVIEDNFVTEGPDAGRMKNTELARAQADNESLIHDRVKHFGDTPTQTAERARAYKHFQEKLENGIKVGIGRQAILKAVEDSPLRITAENANAIATRAVLPARPDAEMMIGRHIPAMVEEAQDAVSDYNQLSREVGYNNAQAAHTRGIEKAA